MSRPTETSMHGIAGRTIVPPVARGEQRAGGQERRKPPDAHRTESDGASHREAAGIGVADKLLPYADLLAGPDLLTALQQPDMGDGQEISGAVPFEEPSLDLQHLRTERAAQTHAAHVVDVEGDLGT